MGRRTTGRLYRRGRTWWLDFAHKGRRVRTSLGASTKAEAEERAAAILAPYRAGNEATLAKMAAALVQDAESAPAADAPAAPRDPLLTVPEVMRILRVSRATTTNLFNRGVLHRVKVGGSTRVRLSDIEALGAAPESGAGQ